MGAKDKILPHSTSELRVCAKCPKWFLLSWKYIPEVKEALGEEKKKPYQGKKL